MIVKGVTKSGFEYSVDTRQVMDYRYMRMLIKLADDTLSDMEKLTYSMDVIELLLGKDGVDDLCEHIAASNDGFAPSDIVIAEALEINTFVANKSKEVKN